MSGRELSNNVSLKIKIKNLKSTGHGLSVLLRIRIVLYCISFNLWYYCIIFLFSTIVNTQRLHSYLTPRGVCWVGLCPPMHFLVPFERNSNQCPDLPVGTNVLYEGGQ